jgi:hypothetical protein
MWKHHRRLGHAKEDGIATRWGTVLSEDPIPAMRFTYPDDSHFNEPLTVVYHHKRFDTAHHLLNFLFNYDNEARDATCQGFNEKVERGWFVRPPAVQPTKEQLGDWTTLKEQVSAIWPNQFNPTNVETYYLHMIMKVPISGRTSRIVRTQEIGDRGGLGKRSHEYKCLEAYLRHTTHSTPDRVDPDLFQYETMVDIPTPESKTIMQIYVSSGREDDQQFIPLLDYLKSSLSDDSRLVDRLTCEIMRKLCTDSDPFGDNFV